MEHCNLIRRPIERKNKENEEREKEERMTSFGNDVQQHFFIGHFFQTFSSAWMALYG